jgi:hypothetical protein
MIVCPGVPGRKVDLAGKLRSRGAATALSPRPFSEALVKYLPPFEVLKNTFDIAAVKGELKVSASYEDFVRLVRFIISSVEVDEDWYLKRYPDVAKAIQEGKIVSARRHFIDDGYLEGRLPFRPHVDEEWYLAENSDVAKGVRARKIESAFIHFIDNGYKEGRLPFKL